MYRMIRRWLSAQSGRPLLAAGAALLLLTLIPLKLIVILLALGLLSAIIVEPSRFLKGVLRLMFVIKPAR